MSDSARLLELIEDGIVSHGGDLGGWTRRSDESLQLFDGRVTLRAEVHDGGEGASEGMVHAHVLTTLHEHEDEVLDACVFGMGDNNEAALGQAAFIWLTCVAGPIKSFLDNKPICMTCQAGVAEGDPAEGYSRGDYGLPGLRAYVGPSIFRGSESSENVQVLIDDTKPWFRFAAESAAPRRVHLAKVSIVGHGKEGWRRELEIDGHDVSHVDHNWPAGVQAPELGYMIRYAVFEFPRNSQEIVRRAELERTIRHFAENYSKYGQTEDSIDRLMEDMVAQGFDADMVHETESISTIAFSRILFEPLGAQPSATIIRARRDGRVEAEVPLMSLPAYSRARALALQLRETMSEECFQSLCLYNAESHLIMQALESGKNNADLSQMRFYPLVVPELGVSNQTMNAALALLNDMVERGRKKKPWWKFW